MTAPLRSPPDGDPRPRRLDMDVVLLAVERHTEITKWAERRLYDFGGDPAYAEIALAEAIEHGDGDIERAAKALRVLQKWEPDFLLRNHIASAVKHLPECWRYLTMRWVLRTGIRFPARVGDLILFDDGEHHRKGRVLKLDAPVAAATVEAESGMVDQVLAERVLANITNGNYGHMRAVATNVSFPILSGMGLSGIIKPCDSE